MFASWNTFWRTLNNALSIADVGSRMGLKEVEGLEQVRDIVRTSNLAKATHEAELLAASFKAKK